MVPSLAAKKVLVVEDESLIAMDLQNMLTGAGYEVLGPVGTITTALEMISQQEITAAIMDANLEGENSVIVATALTKSNVPYLVVTGYDLKTLPSALQIKHAIQKPYDHQLVLLKLELLLRTEPKIN